MDENTTVNKKKELLPDILGHQERMRKRGAILDDVISKFESEWCVDRTKEKLDPTPHDPDKAKDDIISTVDKVYKGMSELEGEFDALSSRLSLISYRYLGEKEQ